VHCPLLQVLQHWPSPVQLAPGVRLHELARVVPGPQQKALLPLPEQVIVLVPHRHEQVVALKVFPLVQAARQVLLLWQKFGVAAGHSHWHVVGLKNDFGALHAAMQVLLLWQKFGKLLLHWNEQVPLAVQTNVALVGTLAFGQHWLPHLWKFSPHVKPQMSCPSAFVSHCNDPPSGTSASGQHIAPHLVKSGALHVKPQVPLAVQVNVPPSGTSASGQHN
jgi:hypothetical protein